MDERSIADRNLESPVISVVVPVYNVEDYLTSCLDSIVRQTYRNYEVILVDDGSDDSSPEICDRYADRYSQFRAIHQANEGVVAARAKGTAAAGGEYVTYVDADDLLLANALESLTSDFRGQDIITAGAVRESAHGGTVNRLDGIEEGDYQGAGAEYLQENMLLRGNSVTDGILPYCFAKLYNREKALEAWQNVPADLTIGEDRAFVCAAIAISDFVTVTHSLVYRYRYRRVSAMHAANSHYLRDLDLFYNYILSLGRKCGYSDEFFRRLNRFVTSRLYSAPQRLGFAWDQRMLRFFWPYGDLFDGKTILLFGAGEVGENYYRELRVRPLNRLLWTDNSLQGREDHGLIPVEAALGAEFDIAIPAVKYADAAKQIRQQLLDAGVPAEKICWKPPIEISAL